MPTIYADASALVKLVRIESHSKAVREYLEGADLISSELILAEVPRALRRRDGRAGGVRSARSRRGDRGTDAADPRRGSRHHGRYMEPLDAFLTYDVRQAASARLAGLRTVAPGA